MTLVHHRRCWIFLTTTILVGFYHHPHLSIIIFQDFQKKNTSLICQRKQTNNKILGYQSLWVKPKARNKKNQKTEDSVFVLRSNRSLNCFLGKKNPIRFKMIRIPLVFLLFVLGSVLWVVTVARRFDGGDGYAFRWW